MFLIPKLGREIEIRSVPNFDIFWSPNFKNEWI